MQEASRRVSTRQPKRLRHWRGIRRTKEPRNQGTKELLMEHVLSTHLFVNHRLNTVWLEKINLFARERGVEVLLENIPNQLSSAERLISFLQQTHLKMNFCLDVGHANMKEGVSTAYTILKGRIRSTHLHDNNGKEDSHLWPFFSEGGSIDCKAAMALLRSVAGEYPLLLELREFPEFPLPQSFEIVKQVFERLESI